MTAPPSSVTCEVWVNGARLADTADTYLASTPTALEGLSVTWGRDNTMDQPATSTCSLDVADVDDDTDYLHRLHVGDRLAVYAAGRVHAAGDPYDVAVDGSFEYADPSDRVAAAAAAVTVDTSHVDTGARNLAAVPTGKSATLAIPPAPFAPTSNADEWRTVPTVSPGDHWTFSLTVTPGRGQRVTMSAALFRHPQDRNPRKLAAHVTIDSDPADVITTTVLTLDWTVTAADGAGYPGVILTVEDQPWKGTAGGWDDQFGAWDHWGTLWFDTLRILAPPTAIRRVLVFVGRITDLAASWSGGTRCAITASDWTVELSNEQISSPPWPAQTIAARVAHIGALSDTPFTVDIDDHPAALHVTWRDDVDAQPVATLLSELAVTADAVLWPSFTATRGFYLWMEDPAERGALGTLYLDDDTDLVEITTHRPAAAVTLSACDFLADGVTWTQDASDIVTRVSVTWQEQTLDYGGTGVPWSDLNPTTTWAGFGPKTWHEMWGPAPTERRVYTTDAELLDKYGIRALDWTTQLTSEADAVDVATRIFVRSNEVDWHATGLTWDTRIPVDFSDGVRAVLLDMLDGTRRIGLPLIGRDMPAWTPTGPLLAAYIEGGQYDYAGGRWTLALNASPSPRVGASVLWMDLDPAWRWLDFDPLMTWQQLWGVTSTHASPRWRTLDDHAWADDPNLWRDYIS